MKVFLIAFFVLLNSCTGMSPVDDVETVEVVYVSPELGVPEGTESWTGGGYPWQSVDIDSALLNFPIGGLLPHGATITGFEVRWFQDADSGAGPMTAVLYKSVFGDRIESGPVGTPLLISGFGRTTVDEKAQLSEVIDSANGYTITIETFGTEQTSRFYELIVYYKPPGQS